ncbi:cysteine and glycine-rich protein 1-like isoform X1 [Mercenaria mercenaria]|uniref:cysteine and glycine-rich protein 1-like isoform X1 n=2 Tax=Mercenaria mercenaria TaxID=6596 RepID=UPI00234E53BA|nr:cysteine and glycine-rich protein 1-like isoform X1 [Mercenaria mercenaria]
MSRILESKDTRFNKLRGRYYCLQRVEIHTMSDRCPRCSKPVYFAEQMLALGKKYHKLCLKCAECNKLLDSYTCTNHEDDIFCKACYGKKFGPKGYGFAGGAGGLSMDTGKPYEVTRGNVSSYQQAQAAPTLERNGGGGRWGGGDACPRCKKQVYFAEEVRAVGKKWHKMCLSCAKCSKMLDSTSCTDHEGEVFCKACHTKMFGPKGYGFAGGASGLSMDTGKYGEVTRENVSSFSQAQAAPLLENGTNKFGGGELCAACGKTVYFAEKIMGGNSTYHKQCFKCAACKKGLDSHTMTQRENDVFCKSCYSKHFGPKGFGFGSALQHT